MFVFDSLNALKASTEIVEGVLYKAPDALTSATGPWPKCSATQAGPIWAGP